MKRGWVSIALVAVACTPPPPAPDGGEEVDGGPTDSGTPTDASVGDAGFDAGTSDAGFDAGTPDAGPPDAGFDAGPGTSTPLPFYCFTSDGGAFDAGVDEDAGVTLRIAAANLTSGNLQSWTPGNGLRILQGIHPDVVLVQEFKYVSNTPADFDNFGRAWLASGCWTREGSSLPNGVVSRWPIIESGRWSDSRAPDRQFVYARIDVPGPRDLWAVSVHMLTNSMDRPAEASELRAHILARVPPGDLVALGGDFNTGSRTESAMTTLASVFRTVAPWPADQSNNTNTNAGRNSPYDWVLADAELDARRVPTVIGANSFDAGAVIDTRVYNPISDLAPAVQSDSMAPNMQHMGVVRDFALP